MGAQGRHRRHLQRDLRGGAGRLWQGPSAETPRGTPLVAPGSSSTRPGGLRGAPHPRRPRAVRARRALGHHPGTGTTSGGADPCGAVLRSPRRRGPTRPGNGDGGDRRSRGTGDGAGPCGSFGRRGGTGTLGPPELARPTRHTTEVGRGSKEPSPKRRPGSCSARSRTASTPGSRSTTPLGRDRQPYPAHSAPTAFWSNPPMS